MTNPKRRRHHAAVQIDAPGAFYRQLSGYVLPILLQSLISALVNSADVVMLGFVGQRELSAVSLAGQIAFLLSLFYSGIVTGVVMLASQYWGKGDTLSISRLNGIALRFSMSVACVFFLVSLLFPRQLMLIFTAEEDLLVTGSAYLRIVSLSYLFMGVSQVCMAVMKSVQRMRVTTLISSCCLMCNIVLNAVFIFGLFGLPKMGAAGVAFATVLARLGEMIWCLIDARRCKTVRVRFLDLLPAKSKAEAARTALLCRDFIHYSSPSMANFLVWGGGFSMYSVILGHLGTDAVAANSVVTVVRELAAILGTGIGSGGALYLGNVMGSGRLEQAKRDGGRLCRLALVFGCLGGAGILLCRPFLTGLLPLSDTAAQYLSGMLLINSYYCVAQVMNSTLVAGIFCAGGDTRFGFLCDCIVMWGFAVPLGLLTAFVFRLPVLLVYFCLCLDELVKLPFVYRHYKQYKWLKNITREFNSSSQPNSQSNLQEET